jgi:hypothetical protein
VLGNPGDHLSQPIPPTPITSLDPTLPALEYISRQRMIALFTIMTARDVPPILMRAIMSASEQIRRLSYAFRSHGVLSGHIGNVSVDEDVGARKQTIFVPLVASAGLPREGADIAKLGSTAAATIDSARRGTI